MLRSSFAISVNVSLSFFPPDVAAALLVAIACITARPSAPCNWRIRSGLVSSYLKGRLRGQRPW